MLFFANKKKSLQKKKIKRENTRFEAVEQIKK
jgi:hypothetical protein